MESEFGKGFVYCLFLFAKHRERKINVYEKKYDYGLWFNGAADHLFEMEIPKEWERKKIGRLAKWIKERGMAYRLKSFEDEVTEKDFNDFFVKCEELTRLVDKELGIKTIKADWN